MTKLGHLTRGAAQTARTETTHVHAWSRRTGGSTQYRVEWIYYFRNSREESFLVK